MRRPFPSLLRALAVLAGFSLGGAWDSTEGEPTDQGKQGHQAHQEQALEPGRAVLATLSRVDAFRDRLGRDGVLEQGTHGGVRLAISRSVILATGLRSSAFHPAGGPLDVEIPLDAAGALRVAVDDRVWINVTP